MPWKGVTVSEQRERFLEDYQLNYYSVSELAERFSISRKTAHPGLTTRAGKWIARFEELGHGGYQEQSRRPHSCPWQTDQAVVEEILGLRKAHPHWGSRKLLDLMQRHHEGRDLPAVPLGRRERHLIIMIAALFDIEGTLYSMPMGRGFIEYARRDGRWLRALLYYALLMPKYSLNKLGIISEESLNRSAIARMPWLIRGYDLHQAARAFDWVANRFILPSGVRPVLERWERHRQLGHLLLIVSSGLTPCVERIGAHLGAAGVVGTDLETRDGRFSGRLASPVAIGREKARRATELVSKRGVDVDWGASSAYADSIHDLPVLELVGHPVAVQPGSELALIARERGWEAIQLRGG
ncbi:MAG: HAD-IB family hydrolase [Chloroflexi bacterium]|nr:HAD-IB family hydrolase [Chloroflexota bacterium]